MTVLEHKRLQESLEQRNHYLAAAVTEARGAVHTLREPTFETLCGAFSALAASVALIAEALQCDVLGSGHNTTSGGRHGNESCVLLSPARGQTRTPTIPVTAEHRRELVSPPVQ
jgi:hypothetical protein